MPQYIALVEFCIREEVIARPLLQKTLILVAHPDDEALGCGALLQRMQEPFVVFATDGSPQDPYFWKKYGSRTEYGRVRRDEAQAALNELGITHSLSLDMEDQRLHERLERARTRLRQIITEFRPLALLTHAYEGGHPDHDTCAFLGEMLGREFQVPVWEMPLYQRASWEGKRQTFITGDPEFVVRATPEELRRKRLMIARYESQGLTTAAFDLTREVFRRQVEYDFSQPPHAGKLNYEAWQWSMTGADVCRAFTEFRNSQGKEMFAECSRSQ